MSSAETKESGNLAVGVGFPPGIWRRIVSVSHHKMLGSCFRAKSRFAPPPPSGAHRSSAWWGRTVMVRHCVGAWWWCAAAWCGAGVARMQQRGWHTTHRGSAANCVTLCRATSHSAPVSRCTLWEAECNQWVTATGTVVAYMLGVTRHRGWPRNMGHTAGRTGNRRTDGRGSPEWVSPVCEADYPQTVGWV